jgi:hypothetical protein
MIELKNGYIEVEIRESLEETSLYPHQSNLGNLNWELQIKGFEGLVDAPAIESNENPQKPRFDILLLYGWFSILYSLFRILIPYLYNHPIK